MHYQNPSIKKSKQTKFIIKLYCSHNNHCKANNVVTSVVATTDLRVHA